MPTEREPRDLGSLLVSVRDALEGAIEWLDGPFVAHAERRKECRIAIIRLDEAAALAHKQAERIADLEKRNQWLEDRASGALLVKLAKHMETPDPNEATKRSLEALAAARRGQP